MIEYKILLHPFDEDRGVDPLVEDVNAQIALGWEPLGGVAITSETEFTRSNGDKTSFENNIIMAQAMTKIHAVPHPASSDEP